MRLRKLEEKDAPLMLEWMHDESVIEYMQADFITKTINDCLSFIKQSKEQKGNLNLAIVDDNDEYMGTVSLKNITKDSAEFAIAIRNIAMGKGFSKYGITEIIRIAFEELHLNQVYWNVLPDNIRAIKFYDKCGYQRINPNNLEIFVGGGYYVWQVSLRLLSLVRSQSNFQREIVQLNIIQNFLFGELCKVSQRRKLWI